MMSGGRKRAISLYYDGWWIRFWVLKRAQRLDLVQNRGAKP